MCGTFCVNAEVFKKKSPYELQFNNEQHQAQFLDSCKLHAQRNPHPPTHNLSIELILLSTIYTVQKPPFFLTLTKSVTHLPVHIRTHLCQSSYFFMNTKSVLSISNVSPKTDIKYLRI